MKRLFVAVLFVSLVAGVTLVAQEHSMEKKSSDEITITMPVKIGARTLDPAKYRIACARNEVTFTRTSDNQKILALPCKGKEMSEKAANTELHTNLNKESERVVDKLLIRGSTLEHVF